MICICPEPHGDYWQLGPLTTDRGSIVLLGWHLIPTPVDAGMPGEVGLVLARATTSLARVTYLRFDAKPSLDGSWRSNKGKMVRSLLRRLSIGIKNRIKLRFG